MQKKVMSISKCQTLLFPRSIKDNQEENIVVIKVDVYRVEREVYNNHSSIHTALTMQVKIHSQLLYVLNEVLGYMVEFLSIIIKYSLIIGLYKICLLYGQSRMVNDRWKQNLIVCIGLNVFDIIGLIGLFEMIAHKQLI